MQWTSTNELREKFLSFFESKDHLRLPSYPLVPRGDKSILLINAGMTPLKKFFTGEETPPRKRVATCQKCMRTPDLERVGITARHGTYFEMLGNFSFGDYFKSEAIPWAWEFLTVCLGIPAELLYPSIYEEDEEAFDIWTKVVGVAPERITRLGKADNFWEHGSGPCGPCSEIYFDRGEAYGCGSPDCGPGCDCDRYMEIWNNVFTQFDSDGKGNYALLANKNIDTGMGLERLACVMQSVDNMFEIDTIRKILDTVCEISGKKYGASHKDDVSIRIITDHIRASSFLICDGVLPSNEGRGYVLRRILRRAARHGKLLGIDHQFLSDLCDVVIGENEGAYPELRERRDYIRRVISIEEERFDATIDSGLGILSELIAAAKESGTTAIAGEDAFRLYDTFGFPVDLTREIAAEQGLGVDDERFAALMLEQKTRARSARANISGWSDASKSLLSDLPATVFTGYGEIESAAKIIAIIADDMAVDEISEGEFTLVLDRTPFYGEGGGQVGDSGVITGEGFTATVSDTKKTDGVYLHLCTVDGVAKVGDGVTATVDGARRDSIRRNHSSAHLLQAALREVLGTHVEQAGSYVDAERVRFDFSHFQAMTADELARVEALVNAHIMAGAEVTTVETDVESAKKLGAMALFGEKYGSVVRVVSMGGYSCELCGGTHIDNTAKLGLFKIISETSVAAGVRRIEGTTGYGVLAMLAERDALINETAKTLKANNPADIARKAAQAQTELRDAHREIDALDAKLANAKAGALKSGAVSVGGVRLITADLGDMTTDAARSICDSFKESDPDLVTVFAVHSGEKLNFIAACGKDAVAAGAHAGNILKAVSAVAGGKGGGRPDSATSGGRDIGKIADALAEARKLLTK